MEFDVMQLISSGLFPIAMTLLMWKHMTEQEAKTRDVIHTLDLTVRELKTMIEAIFNKQGGTEDDRKAKNIIRGSTEDIA